MLYKNRKRINKNGYVVVEYPEHPKAFDTGSGIIGVYEHILIAEQEVLGRDIRDGEVVHHLDEVKNNNSPDNLLVLSNPMHVKLHSWMNKNNIEPTEKYKNRIDRGCVRCVVCEIPIEPNLKFCSHNCANDFSRSQKERPDKQTLEKLLWEKPTTHIAKDFGVSDKTIENLSKSYEIEKPPRGYWAKQNAKKALENL